MRISYSWLSKYVDLPADPQGLADTLTMAGLEVEAVWDRHAFLDTVRVARVLSCEPLAGSDHLSLCRVEAGGSPVSVVCGAGNVRVGLLAPLALPGTRLPDGSVVEAREVRGLRSEGMLCSEWELGVGLDRSGLMELSSGLAVGASVNKALGLSDPCLEISITPNRPDCLSLLGIAREVSAITGAALRPPEAALPPGEGDITAHTSVTIDSPDHCPRYSARLLLSIAVGPSPFWLADRLISLGLRPINNIVDVTNFVMMETGQPLHAFDFDLLAQNRIVVRTASEGERFTTLDSQEKTLSADMLMICDGERPVALAGVMGGLNSEISGATKNVLIESAYFNPASIRKTARRLGYHTEASHRFERGTDPEGTVSAADRAAQLMLETAGGALVSGVADAHPAPWEGPVIGLSAARTNAILGTEIPAAEIRSLLASVSMEVRELSEDRMEVRPPGFRPDVTRPEDLVEEVARLWGYDRIPVTSPVSTMEAPALDPAREFTARVKDLAVSLGFGETIQYSFASVDSPDRLGLPPDHEARRILPIRNPLTEDQAVMRTSLFPGLLETVARNLNQNNRDLWIFEAGKVFLARGADELPDEPQYLVLFMTGSRPGRLWGEKPEPCGFFDMKGAVEGLLAGARIPEPGFERLAAADCHALVPGRAASVRCRDALLGTLGQVRPEVAAAFGVKAPVFAAELSLDALLLSCADRVRYRPLPRFPATTRDVTLVLDRRVEASQVLARVRAFGHEWMESVDLVDVYEGQAIPEGRKSLSVRVTYR
ncbi:MAG: phenylalanine--tRNA ligase subunit beta, partial [Proteobacteria bacterium]|nr:phenylalanine--tRNA ligase subunit beta [Pseudomonadota bacterium]